MKSIVSNFLAVFVFSILIPSAVSLPEDKPTYITSKKQSGTFTLSESGRSAPLLVSSQDFPGLSG